MGRELAPTPPSSRPAACDEARAARRSFLESAWAGWAFTCAASCGAAAAAVRFLFPDDLGGSSERIRIGRPETYAPGSVDGRWADRGIWIVRERRRLFALSGNCTHLGCAVRWVPSEGKFRCPCHGSGFRPDGINFEGPAPRPLERLRMIPLPGGEVEVDPSRRFQEELGQWDDPGSWVDVS